MKVEKKEEGGSHIREHSSDPEEKGTRRNVNQAKNKEGRKCLGITHTHFLIPTDN